MTNELTPTPLTPLDQALKEGEESFLPSIRVLHPNSSEVEEGTAQKGDVFCKDTGLGKSTTIIVANYRWNASLVENGTRTKQSFNADSPVSKALKADDLARKSIYPAYVVRRGVEFLVFVPAMDTYALFHPNTYTARQAVSAKIVNTIRPLDERSEAAKKLPYTRFFKLSSRVKDNKYNTIIPHIEAIDADESQASTPQALKEALDMFASQVDAEAKMEPSDDNNER